MKGNLDPQLEIWKDIKNYENQYQVSNFGRVKSLERIIKIKDKKKGEYCRTVFGCILVPNLRKDGYVFVNLNKNNKKKAYKIHRIVANTFIPNPENKSQVNHKNGIKSDNRVENLEWTTPHENMIHSYRVLHCKRSEGVRGKATKKSKIVFQIKDGKIIRKFYGCPEASRITGIDRSQIQRCCGHKRNAKIAGGFQWEYGNRTKE